MTPQNGRQLNRALEQHRLVHLAHRLEQLEVLHIACADLHHVHILRKKRLIAVFVTFVVMVWISAYALAYKPCFEVVNTLISLFLFQGCFSFVLPFSPLSQ